jgi:hypothetical protein
MLLCVVLLSGCVSNGYRAFYHELPDAQDTLAQRVYPAPAEPKLDRLAGQFQDVQAQYTRAGYVAIGYSSYNGPTGREADALAQGKTVGADVIVVMSPRFTETVSSSIPVTTPTSETTYTNSNATVYGSGGTANVYGNSTSTTYGTSTTYIPVTTHRYNFEAVYLVKRKFTFGAQFAPLTDEERMKIQSNKGVRIQQVVNDTPAFEADILVGDIVLAVNGRGVSSTESLQQMLQNTAGQRLELAIIRNGEPLTKIVQIP